MKDTYQPTSDHYAKGSDSKPRKKQKRKTPFKAKKFRNDTFPFTVIYAEGGTNEDLEKFCKQSICDPDCKWPILETHGAMVTRGFGQHSLIWVPDRSDMSKKKWREFVTHESLHAVNTALTQLGMCVDYETLGHPVNSSDEPWCYVQGWLLRKIGVFKK